MMLFCLLGFVGICLLGSLFHFVFKWSGDNKFVGFFVAVNESTWEHLKLAFLPIFIWGIIGLRYDFNNYALGVFIALLIILIITPAIYYGYSFFLKKSILIIDISSFFIAAGLSMYCAFSVFNLPELSVVVHNISIVGIILFVVAFSIFTFFPPHNFLFRDPISKIYGFPPSK